VVKRGLQTYRESKTVPKLGDALKKKNVLLEKKKKNCIYSANESAGKVWRSVVVRSERRGGKKWNQLILEQIIVTPLKKIECWRAKSVKTRGRNLEKGGGRV